jgi:FKBP-type peptidyl-prolyl cis-trans isomerase FkpA
MTIKNRYAALCAIPALAALALPTTPALAAAPKAPAKPVLTCKTKAAEGLTYTVLKASKGAKPTDDARVVVNYRGFLKSDGSEFDSGEGAKFRVTGVIPGFSQGLKLMAPGSKYRLCIPSAIGYGEEGSGPIPANADLVFEVELLSFETLPPKPAVPADARACDKTTATGLMWERIAVAQQHNRAIGAPVHRDAVIPGEILLIVARQVGPRNADHRAVIELDFEQGDIAQIAHPLDLPAGQVVVFRSVLRCGTDRFAFAGDVEIDLLWPQRDPDIGAVRAGDPVVEINLAQPGAFHRRAVGLVERQLAFEQVHRTDEIGDKPIGGIFVKIGRCRHLRHFAFVHHRNPPAIDSASS